MNLTSKNNKYYSTTINGADKVYSIVLNKKYTRRPCIFKKSYGFHGKRVWVRHGCSASFNICVKRSIKKPVNKHCILKTLSSSWKRGQFAVMYGAHRVVYMKPKKKLSKIGCHWKKSFGFYGSRVWVKRGCKATFSICYIRQLPKKNNFCINKVLKSPTMYVPAETNVAFASRITRMMLHKRFSGHRCSPRRSFGYIGSMVWVTRGCRATFEVCYKNSGPKPVCKTQRVLSHKKKYTSAYVNGSGKITAMFVKRKIYKSSCIFGLTYGFNAKMAWVRKGCGADFKICYMKAKPKFVHKMCISQRLASWGRKNYMTEIDGASKIKSLRLRRKLSRNKCIYRKTFGFKGKRVWVKKGCRGDFKVCFIKESSTSIKKLMKNRKCHTISLKGGKKATILSKAAQITCLKLKKHNGGCYKRGRPQFFYQGARVWTSRGCNADFRVCYKPWKGPDEKCPVPKLKHHKCVKVFVKGGQRKARIHNAQWISCMKMKASYRGRKGCVIKGKPQYYYKNYNVWAKKGCSAAFIVCFKPWENVAPSCPALPKTPLVCIYKHVASWGNRHYRTKVDGADKIASMKIVKKISRNRCVRKRTYGFRGSKVWVHKGCRAVFKVCYDKGIGLGGIGKKRCIRKWIKSWGNSFTKVGVDGAHSIVSMKLKKKTSIAGCYYKRSYGFVNGKAWTDKGCRGLFEICFDSSLKCVDITVRGGAKAKTLVKASRVSCMKIKKELSKNKCWKYGEPLYKFKGRKVWASKGCQAIYTVCYKPFANKESACPKAQPRNVCVDMQVTSGGGQYKSVIYGARRITRMQLKKNLSKMKCQSQKNYGFRLKEVWSNNGCSGIFTVCYDRDMRPKCIQKEVNSWSFKHIKSKINGAGRIFKMQVIKKSSTNVCKFRQSFGYNGRDVWVAKGCRAVFNICYDGASAVNTDTCEDVTVTGGKTAQLVNNADKISCMTLKKEYSTGKCWKNGKPRYRFYKNKVVAAKGCKGLFSVCYKLACRKPFKNYDGRCLFVESRSKRTYVEAAKKCAQIGARLAEFTHPLSFASKFEHVTPFKNKLFFIGGSLTGVISPKKLAMMPRPTSLCKAIDFEDAAKLKNCHDRQHFICQEVEGVETRWSSWINADRRRPNDIESLSDITKKYNAGQLRITPLNMCTHPLAIQCRDARTKKMYYAGQSHGLKLDSACVHNRIACIQSKQQRGRKCPDFEVRFQCVKTPELNCANGLVRESCEINNKNCKNIAFGPNCKPKPIIKTGVEVIGTTKCSFNNRVYTLKQCVSRVDPYVTSFDGVKIKDFKSNSARYVFFESSNNKIYDVPDFKVITSNKPMVGKGGIPTAREFEFIVGGTTYTFKKGGKFEVDGLSRSPLDFQDDNLEILIQMKGSKTGQPKMTIQTRFCVQIVWDTRMALYLRVPSQFKNSKMGLCGNLDGNPDNDLMIPGSDSPSTAADYTHYFMVAQKPGSSGCLDCRDKEPKCTKKQIAKYSGAKFCGVFNPAGKSPLVKYILKTGNYKYASKNRAQLAKLFGDCLNNHCRLKKFNSGRCFEMQTHIEEIAKDLAMTKFSRMDRAWRQYAKCQNTILTKCKNMPHSHYEASYLLKCQPTCTSASESKSCMDTEFGSGCVCNKGYFLNSQLKCVPLSQCEKQCTVELDNGEHFTLAHGKTAVITPCIKSVKCVNGQVQEKVREGCSAFAVCAADGMTCACREGFTGNGRRCKSTRPCRKGYVAYGDLCYKYVTDATDWNSAAILCGAEGSHLARYDSEQNVELKNFMPAVKHEYLKSVAMTRYIRCAKGQTCRIPKNEFGVDIQFRTGNAKACGSNNYGITSDKKSIFVRGKCSGKFAVKSVPGCIWSKRAHIAPWVGGNTHVLGWNKRNGKIAFQVDPPRLIDAVSTKLGCFQAKMNEKNQLVLEPNPNCNKKKSFICEYENNGKVPYNPQDIVGIAKKLNQQSAFEACKKLGRPLLKISYRKQLNAAKKILKEQLRGDAWLDARFVTDFQQSQRLKWSDGTSLLFWNWKKIPKARSGRHEKLCIKMQKSTGFWVSERCSNKQYPLCGPPTNVVPTAFTPPFPVPTVTSLKEIIKTLHRLSANGNRRGLRRGKRSAKKPTYWVCDKPLEIKCRARHVLTRQWINNLGQVGNTITCTASRISCKKGQEFDCSTLETQFLCPIVSNQCKALGKLGSTACEGGRMCHPVTNHYVCQCPKGVTYNPDNNKCIGHCGACNVRGDPHYTTYTGMKYTFMGQCTYKFAGVKDQYKKNNEWFDVITKNNDCGKKGKKVSCLDSVKVILKNMRVVKKNVAIKKDYTFEIKVKSNSYKLNNNLIKKRILYIPGVLTAVVKKNYFDLIVTRLELRVFLSGPSLTVHAPTKLQGKMDGLCGDCGNNAFLLRSGKHVYPPLVGKKWSTKKMAAYAVDWLVADARSKKSTCKKAPVPPKCPRKLITDLKKKTKCGILMDSRGPLRDCFKIKSIDRRQYFNDCVYDTCQTNTKKSMCSIVKAYAQACLEKGVVLDWRDDDFCPFKCKKNEVYRADSSCEATCGKTHVTGLCSEEPEEGCICRPGLVRQGTKCVKPDKCGCKVPMPDGTKWNLPAGKTLMMPGCSEKVTCKILPNGVGEGISKTNVMPQHAICNDGPPSTVTCAKGYKMSKNGKKCIRLPGTCKEGYSRHAAMCLSSGSGTIWRNAIKASNNRDGTLVYVDTAYKLKGVIAIMQKKGLTSAFIAGKVKVVKKGNKLIFKPALKKYETHAGYANFMVPKYILRKVKISKQINLSKIPGAPLAIQVTLTKFGKVVITAVPSLTKCGYISEQRETKPKDTEWTPLCNTDSLMSDGDREYLASMLSGQRCRACPVPYAVKCKAVGKGKNHGVCSVNAEGLLYRCDMGSTCIDKAVQTKCTRDLDECALGYDDCGKNQKCVNTQGAYTCKCSNPDYPLMINGKCEGASKCSFTGPQKKNGYTYTFNGFENVPGLFTYDCSYVLAAPGKYVYKPSSKLPYADFAVLTDRSSGQLNLKVMGTVYHPSGNTIKAWTIDSNLMSRQQFLFGKADELKVTNLNHISKETQMKFLFKEPGVFVINSFENHFRARITLNPFSFKLTVRDDIASKMYGVCSLEPESKGDEVYMTPKETAQISVGTPECRPFIPSTTPAAPATTTITPRPRPETTPQPGTYPPTSGPVTGHPGPVTYGPTSGTYAPIPDTTTREPVTSGPNPTLPPNPYYTTPGGPTQEPVTFKPPCNVYNIRNCHGHTVTTVVPTLPTLPGTSSTKKPNPTCPNQASRLFCDILEDQCMLKSDVCLKESCYKSFTEKCKYLTKLSLMCNQTSSTLQALIDNMGCSSVCSPNKIFSYGTVSGQPTCENPNSMPEDNDDDDGDMEFGCYCPRGFLMSGTRCVRPHSCGCNTPDGYKKPYTIWRSANCSVVYRCRAGGFIDQQVSSCGTNTTCAKTENGPQCQCLKGMYGNPTSQAGCSPGTEDPDGSKVCYKYVRPDGSIDNRCNCSLGFISNCDGCEDIDECKLGIHDCELPKETCKNVYGGYTCECAKGYKQKEDDCVDIDECKNRTSPCGFNSACVNKIGSFECKCCAGYKLNATSKKCDRDTDAIDTLPANAQCCAVCSVPEICKNVESEPKPICYYNEMNVGMDFDNGLTLFQYLCLNSMEYVHTKARIGMKCSDVPPNSTPTPITVIPKSTTLGPETTTLGPLPLNCTDPSLPAALPAPPADLESGKVCGPSNDPSPQTFDSYKDMLVYVCQKLGSPAAMPKSAHISAYSGECSTTTPESTTSSTSTSTTSTTSTSTQSTSSTTAEPKTTEAPETTPATPSGPKPEPEFESWTQFGSCQFNSGICGIGIQVRTRMVKQRPDGQTPREPTENEVRETRTCYKVCKPPGVCPSVAICDRLDPVCGVIGSGNGKTYKSECLMNVLACKARTTATKLYSGQCDNRPGPQPKLCADGPRVTTAKYYSTSPLEECVGPEVKIKSCGGNLCAGGSTTCCQAASKSPITVNVTCYSKAHKKFTRTKKHVHYTANRCKCVTGNTYKP